MAKAMKLHCWQNPRKMYSVLAAMSEEEWVPLAMIALKAMREPSERAVEEGALVIEDVEENPGLVGGVKELAYRVWQAMLDESAKR